MDEIVAYYVGNGNFLNGVPARDLTRAEWDALDEATRQMCLESGVYQLESAGEPSTTLPSTIVIDTRDGIQDGEATNAARVLQKRRIGRTASAQKDETA